MAGLGAGGMVTDLRGGGYSHHVWVLLMSHWPEAAAAVTVHTIIKAQQKKKKKDRGGKRIRNK